jgi:xanthine dehydrogenase accessory factor
MQDLLDNFERLAASGEPVGRAVVLSVWGSAPRRPGACLLATPSGAMAGSVSGGCVESAVAQEIASVIDTGIPVVVDYGVSDETAWEVGLSCGGELRVFVEPRVRPELISALKDEVETVAATIIGGVDRIGATLIGESWLPPSTKEPVQATVMTATEDVARRARARLATHESGVDTVKAPDGTALEVFFDVHPAPPMLVVFGGVHVAEVLVPMAQHLGFRTVVADGRAAFLTRERFPKADELILGWPNEVFEQVSLTSTTYVCVLTHDPKFDDPAVTIALQSDAAYVGVIGSKRTQRERRKRLEEAGLDTALIDRLHGPIGLALGGREPGEIALAILAEITQVRRQVAKGAELAPPRREPIQADRRSQA